MPRERERESTLAGTSDSLQSLPLPQRLLTTSYLRREACVWPLVKLSEAVAFSEVCRSYLSLCRRSRGRKGSHVPAEKHGSACDVDGLYIHKYDKRDCWRYQSYQEEHAACRCCLKKRKYTARERKYVPCRSTEDICVKKRRKRREM